MNGFVPQYNNELLSRSNIYRICYTGCSIEALAAENIEYKVCSFSWQQLILYDLDIMCINRWDPGNVEDDQGLLVLHLFHKRELTEAAGSKRKPEKEDEMQIPLGTQTGYLVQGREFPIISEKKEEDCFRPRKTQTWGNGSQPLTRVCQKVVWALDFGPVATEIAIVNRRQNESFRNLPNGHMHGTLPPKFHKKTLDNAKHDKRLADFITVKLMSSVEKMRHAISLHEPGDINDAAVV